jgi:hypothetical protein
MHAAFVNHECAVEVVFRLPDLEIFWNSIISTPMATNINLILEYK